MSSKLTVLLDGDDTLWRTQEIYDEIKHNFVSVLEGIGIHERNIVSKLDELDTQRVAIKGFTTSRFLESMMILYAQLSTSYNLPWDITIEEKIINYGDVLKKTPSLYEDTIQSLEQLKKHAQLFLFSIGDQDVQVGKLNKLGLAKYFKGFCIVRNKNRDILENFLFHEGIRPEQSWMVGNSLKSDVIPAVSAGLNTILVDRGSWKYDYSISATNNDLNYFRVQTLNDAAETILENAYISER